MRSISTNKECKSCNHEKNCFIIISFHLQIQCPCIDCMVKPMCSERCKERDDIWFKAEAEHYNNSSRH